MTDTNPSPTESVTVPRAALDGIAQRLLGVASALEHDSKSKYPAPELRRYANQITGLCDVAASLTPTVREQALEEAANVCDERAAACKRIAEDFGKNTDRSRNSTLNLLAHEMQVNLDCARDIRALAKSTPPTGEGMRDKLLERLDGAIKFYAERPCVDADERCPSMEEMSLRERVDLRLLLKDVRAALPSTPAPQRQTVDDAAVERASLAYEKFFEPINGVSDRGKVSYSTCGRGFNNEKEAVDYMKAMRMRAALLAAFPQEN